MRIFTEISDEELQTLAKNGDGDAEEALAERYIRIVRMCARPYFLAGGDSEDLTQEGMLGLLSAIREYDPAKGSSFKTFAETCIHNRIQSAIRAAVRKKHTPLNDGVSLEEVLSDESQSQVAQTFQRIPEEQVLARESEKEFISTYWRCLSRFEAQVLGLYLEGLSYHEMVARTGRDSKAIDNAVQRIRCKLAQLPSGDNSNC
jgi:RNA polymerase sporulation-specific sigma factor